MRKVLDGRAVGLMILFCAIPGLTVGGSLFPYAGFRHRIRGGAAEGIRRSGIHPGGGNGACGDCPCQWRRAVRATCLSQTQARQGLKTEGARRLLNASPPSSARSQERI